MEFKEELDLIKSDNMNPTEQKWVIELFDYCLKRFWEKLEEPDLPGELNDLWWWVKMHSILRKTQNGETIARAMLEKELNRNATKFKNPLYEQTKVVWK